MIISNLPIDLGIVKQNYSTANENRPLLMSGVAGVSSTSDRASESVINNSIYANPSTGTIHADIDFPITEAEIEAIFNGTTNNGENTEPSNEEPIENNEPEPTGTTESETSGEENGSGDPENTEGSSEEGGTS